MLTAVAYIGPIGRGATRPQLFRCQDGEVYVVKTQNNKLGSKVLVNEYLATRLGELLGLCFPPGDIVQVPPSLVQAERCLRCLGIAAGPHFGCRYLHGGVYVGRAALEQAKNKKQMAGVILLDHFLHNYDRTNSRCNLLIRREKDGYRLYGIDNSHAFRRGRWDVALLEALVSEVRVDRNRAYGVLMKHYLRAADYAVYADRLENMSAEFIAEMIAAIPQEWLPDAAERQALARYLWERRCYVAPLVQALTERRDAAADAQAATPPV